MIILVKAGVHTPRRHPLDRDANPAAPVLAKGAREGGERIGGEEKAHRAGSGDDVPITE